MRAILAVAMGVVLSMNVMAGVRPVCAAHARETAKDQELSADELKAKLKSILVTFDWTDAALVDVLKDLEKKTGVKIVAGPKLNAAPVAFSVKGMSADQVLNMIAKLCGATVSYKNGSVTLE